MSLRHEVQGARNEAARAHREANMARVQAAEAHASAERVWQMLTDLNLAGSVAVACEMRDE